MSKTIEIGGRLYSVEQGNVVAGANAIFDDTKGKKQSVINSETDAELLRLDEAKQNVLTFDNAPTEDSNNPVKSGGVYAADAALQQSIEAILALIPSAATALNQLADKAFVNSTEATNTATFRGTYNVVTDLSLHFNSTHQEIATALLSVVQTADNNDYCFVQIPVSDSSGDIRVTERYKFNGTAWSYEYDLNNSGFTADQWAAINSTITLALVQKLGALPTAAELAQQLATKQNTLTFDAAPVAGSDNPVKSGGLYNIIAAINATIPSGASVDNKLVAESRLTQYVAAIVGALDATFNVTSTDGHVNVRLTQVDGAITSVEVLTNDIASEAALNTLTGRVTTNEGNISLLQAAYNALQQSAPVIVEPTDTWPVANPSATVIYRVIDRVNTPPQYYSDYMWNGTAMVLMATYNNAIDPRPKKGSQNLVTSGGVFDNMGALDVSELNATESPHTLATYADLSAALVTIPSDYQKGGMSIKFVQSSDNKYVQFRYMSSSTAVTDFTNVANWQRVDEELKADALDNLYGCTIVDYSSLQKEEGAISGKNWNKDGYNRYHKTIQLSNIKKIVITANDNQSATFIFAKTYNASAASGSAIDTPDSVTSATVVNAGESVVVDVPSTANYLIVTVNSNSADKTPKITMLCNGDSDFIQKEKGLYCISNYTTVGYLKNNGTEIVSNVPTYRTSDFIEVKKGSTIRCVGIGSVETYILAVYSSKDMSTFNSSLSKKYETSNVESCLFTNNSNSSVYVRMSCKNSEITNCYMTVDNVGVLQELYKEEEIDIVDGSEVELLWEYGNINTDGTPILPIMKNKAHSSLIHLSDIEKISCSNTQYIGYCLYDKNKLFITRWFDDNVSTLNVKYLSLANNAVYVSILIKNSDNSNFDLEDNPPILTFTKSIETRFNSSCARADRMKVNNNNLPAIIFNFDDNLQPGDNQIVELFESKGVRCGFAFIGTQENIASYGSLYLDYQRRGFDILNHSAGVSSLITSNYTFAEAKELIVNGLKNIQKGNMIANGFVAPNSEMSEDFIPIVRATHAYHFLGSNGGVYGANTRETDICKLLRYSLESNTKADIKSYIDSCISDGKLLVFYAHTSRLGTTIAGEEFNLAKVEEILDYCIAKRDNLECYLGGCDDAIRYYFDL